MRANAARRGGRLPAEITSFVGRRQDRADVRQLLGTHRLVTLTGVGGVGKTRLAIRVAHDVRRTFPDGVYFVELAALTDPALLAQTVLSALVTTDTRARQTLDILCEHLADQHALLVLDNCEHLIEATSVLVDALLKAAPRLKILATSRQAFTTDGERIYAVSPLAVPDVDTSSNLMVENEFPSVALFADRAAAAVPGFRVTAANQADVVRLCSRLEGIPLAIELAAVRLRVLAVGDLADRLDDRFRLLTQGTRSAPGRHQTLEAAIDYSFSLCSATEQAMWMRAAVFADGFELAAAEAVCADEDVLPRGAVLDTIAALTEKSIFIREDQNGALRFRMLETIREFGYRRLHDAGEDHVRRKLHRDWYASLLERACDEWFGPSQGPWVRTLQLEHANLRAALEHCLAEPDGYETGLAMAGRPYFMWVACGRVTEGQYWLKRLLQTPAKPTLARAWALSTAAYVAAIGNDAASGIEYVEQSLALGEELASRDVVAYATSQRALCYFTSADLPAAIEHFSAALRLYADTGLPDEFSCAARLELAVSHLLMGQVEVASHLIEETRDRCEAAGESWLLSGAIYSQGFVKLVRGELDAAEESLKDALRIRRLFHDTLGAAFALDVLAWTAIASGRSEFGLVLLGAVTSLWQSFGAQLLGSSHMMSRRGHFTDMARADLGDEDAEAALARGADMRFEDVLDYALNDRRSNVARSAAGPARLPNLTRRETEVALLIARGMSNRAIAAKLVIAPRTAESHVENILSKLGFRSRTQIASWVARAREA